MKNADFMAMFVSSTDFNRLLSSINKERTDLSDYVPQTDKLSSQIFNDHMSKIYADLNYFFAKSDLIERACQSFIVLNDANINSIQNEINVLKSRIKALKLVVSENESTVAINEQFNDKSMFESYGSGLYKDKNGEDLSIASYESSKAIAIASKEFHNEQAYTMNIGTLVGGIGQGDISQYTIRAQDVVKVPYELIDGTEIEDGAVAQVEIVFVNPCYVSTIHLALNTALPQYIPKMFYCNDNKALSVPKKISNTEFMSKEEENSRTFSIAPIRIKKLIIPLVQTNYEEDEEDGEA